MERPPCIGVLALQGSYDLHLGALEKLGVPARKIRLPEDLAGIQGLIIPGGESTVMSGVARDCGLFQPLQQAGAAGLPIFGTCAGAILLGQGGGFPERLGLAPVILKRNAYGRQWDSFEKILPLKPFAAPFQCIFIRAPKIELQEPGIDSLEVLGWDGPDPILVQYRNLLLSTFHPELTEDLRVHRYFVERARC
ncbi:MAG: pyridoxal 5'-phosphate synthase glutaminase subunit PdxT [Planctomycetes bacterium]|nr:pyridoxal 5'-phosphate synthase glutaminase subunit PdxT [Planctomycetota bacterium]